jgi:hypothetical protein
MELTGQGNISIMEHDPCHIILDVPSPSAVSCVRFVIQKIEVDMSSLDSGVTGRKPPSERGTHAYSIPQAGRMIGLSRAASYEAAKRGEIPTQEYGGRKIVPKALWDRRLGIEG